jgi:hypothetical protein
MNRPRNIKKLLTCLRNCDILDEFSPKNTDESKKTKTCPAGFEKTFPILYENKTEMQP